MVTPHDIYDVDAKLLLLARGHMLNSSRLDAIKRINKGHDTIHVSADTYKQMVENAFADKIAQHAKLEKDTGYADIKEETDTLLKEMENGNAAPQDALYAVSAELSRKLDMTPPDVICTLINALAPVDEYLQRHSVDVGLLNGLIGKWLNFTKETVDMLILVGLLHDCGKASLPPQVLRAPRRLSIAEFEVIKMHPVFGYELLVNFPEEVRLSVRAHHEKTDGKGYPDGLSGNDIGYMAHITAISDIYDAMVSQRVYKAPINPFYAISQIKAMGGTTLNASIVEPFVRSILEQMVGKPVVMSNGEFGTIHAVDYDDLPYPYILVENEPEPQKSDMFRYCVHML